MKHANTPDPRDIVLASASPRRRELLAQLGLSFRLLANDAEEDLSDPPASIGAILPPLALPLNDHPTLRAWRKLDAACSHAPDSVIIGADTIVVLNNHVLNKPADAADARRMLRRLAGQTHTVYTGIALADMRLYRHSRTAGEPGGLWFELVASDVAVAALSDDEIAAYVATGEPLDKAGAYGIQGIGGRLVESVSGSYTSVVGLPLVQLHDLLGRAGVVVPVDPAAAYRRWLDAMGKEPLPWPPTLP
ncbi:MAG TPA: Maf family protein [Roseiflexaceae bacterium]|nr:Maf family protein [Roseiflexaceae bacterium]HMP40864.1 Maf family protein [Roseiflexaceae bacterium]